MIMWLKISIRNIIKNGRRSITTILAIALGFGAINLFQGYVHNTYDNLTTAAIQGEGLGHLTLFKKDFLTKGKLFPEKYMFSRNDIQKIAGIVSSYPDLKLITPRLEVSGIISNGRNSTIFIAQGLVPDDDVKIRGDISRLSVFEGAYLTDRERSGVVIASDLAGMLNLKKGDDAVVMTNTFSGMVNALDVKVLGIVNTGMAATNDKLVLMTYRHAKDLLDFQGAERLVVLLNGIEKVPSAAAYLAGALRDAGLEVEIKTWRELSAFYNQVKNMFDMIFLFIFAIVVVIVVMSIINTMSMSVMERTREIGTMRAIGYRRYRVISLFTTEGLLLGLLGSFIGLCVFFGVYYFIRFAHVTYVPPAGSTPVPLDIDIVPGALVLNIVFMTALSLAASFFPARKSSRMTVIDALGHV